MEKYTIPFSDLDNSHVKQVGGKNASRGEMFQQLKAGGILVPDGFATTASAYWKFLDENNLKQPLEEALGELDKNQFSNLKETGKKLRELIMAARIPGEFAEAIKKAFHKLQNREKNVESVAVRSSATAEDLPEASFAGQHDSFMNISGDDEVVRAVHKCIASLFTDRAIKYREDNGFDHMDVALTAGIQKMVRSDLACAGVRSIGVSTSGRLRYG